MRAREGIGGLRSQVPNEASRGMYTGTIALFRCGNIRRQKSVLIQIDFIWHTRPTNMMFKMRGPEQYVVTSRNIVQKFVDEIQGVVIDWSYDNDLTLKRLALINVRLAEQLEFSIHPFHQVVEHETGPVILDAGERIDLRNEPLDALARGSDRRL